MTMKGDDIMSDHRISKCRFSTPIFLDKTFGFGCLADKSKQSISESDCENCSNFKSRYIEFPIEVNEIENTPIDTAFTGLGHTCGEIVEIRPCGEEYNDKSFIGIYIGDLPMQLSSSYNSESKTLRNYAIPNPAIFVPELKKIIFGVESFWRKIDSIDDFKGISDADIDNTWYIQLMKSLL
ncbi:hypothetical protein J6A31_04480 [bacterium]|nr:hypothetical protein [bacterium]